MTGYRPFRTAILPAGRELSTGSSALSRNLVVRQWHKDRSVGLCLQWIKWKMEIKDRTFSFSEIFLFELYHQSVEPARINRKLKGLNKLHRSGNKYECKSWVCTRMLFACKRLLTATASEPQMVAVKFPVSSPVLIQRAKVTHNEWKVRKRLQVWRSMHAYRYQFASWRTSYHFACGGSKIIYPWQAIGPKLLYPIVPWHFEESQCVCICVLNGKVFS